MTDGQEHPHALLGPYVRGELGDDETRLVQEHLDECSRCSEEENGVRLLLDDPGEELTELDRARLHHAVVAATIQQDHAPRTPAAFRRLAPYMGAAATLAILAVGVMVTDPFGGDAGETAGNLPEVTRDESVTDQADAGSDDGTGRSFNASQETVQSASGGAESAAKDLGRAEPAPLFEPTAGRMAAADLDRLGREAAPFQNFASAYQAEAAPMLQSRTLNKLTEGRPAAEAELIRACAREVLKTSAHAPVPVYGGYGSLDGEEVLLLGFTWSTDTSGPLDRFMVWAWPRGSCDSPLVYRFGWIRR